jgi:hypothetical protein
MIYVIGILWILFLLALLVGYIRLCLAMRTAAIRRPPYIHFLFVFGAVGSIVFFLPVTGSPIGVLMLSLPTAIMTFGVFISSFAIYRRHRDSRFHRAAFWSGMAYLGFVTLFILAASMFAS